jgi:hypothetical protein
MELAGKKGELSAAPDIYEKLQKELEKVIKIISES